MKTSMIANIDPKILSVSVLGINIFLIEDERKVSISLYVLCKNIYIWSPLNDTM